MPNWCTGVLKVRGEKSNLKKFILEGLKPVDPFGKEGKILKIDEYGDIIYSGKLYIEGTRRGFVAGVDVYNYQFEEKAESVICLDASFAWGIDAGELAEISKKYNVDFKIFAFEKGMEFNQDIEIIKGEIKTDIEIKYTDYKWECINPEIGG